MLPWTTATLILGLAAISAVHFPQAIRAVADPEGQDQADGRGLAEPQGLPPGREAEEIEADVHQDHQERQAVHPGDIRELEQQRVEVEAVTQRVPGEAADDVGLPHLQGHPEDGRPPEQTEAPGGAPGDPQAPHRRVETEIPGQQQENADGGDQGQLPEDVGDVNDPVEQRHIVGQTRNQAQPEGRFQGLAPEGPEEGHQGEDQQISLVPLGEGRGQQQAGEDRG